MMKNKLKKVFHSLITILDAVSNSYLKLRGAKDCEESIQKIIEIHSCSPSTRYRIMDLCNWYYALKYDALIFSCCKCIRIVYLIRVNCFNIECTNSFSIQVQYLPTPRSNHSQIYVILQDISTLMENHISN